MSRIQKFNEYNSNEKFENIQPINEFFGGILRQIFKAAKNRISLSLSKKIGDAKIVDKAIEEYEGKVGKIIDSELAAHKTVIEYERGMEETGDKSDLPQIKKEFEKELSDAKKQKDAIKKVFNVKMQNIIRNSDDDNIKGYVNLSRAELAERLIARELGELKNMGADELAGDSDYKNIIEELEKQATKMTAFAEKVGGKLKEILSGEGKEADVSYKEGDKVKYTRDNGEENEAEVMSQEGVEGERIRLKTDKNQAGFTVGKDKITGKVEVEPEEPTEETIPGEEEIK